MTEDTRSAEGLEIGALVRFRHEPGGPVHRVVSVMQDGMIEIHDMAGYFGPHLFVVADDVADIPPSPRPTTDTVEREAVVAVFNDWLERFANEGIHSSPFRALVGSLRDQVRALPASGGEGGEQHYRVGLIRIANGCEGRVDNDNIACLIARDTLAAAGNPRALKEESKA